MLVADDDESMRTLMEAALRIGGFHVELVDTGTAAIERYPVLKPDMLVLDVEMPGATGFEVCEHIRSGGDALVPIVIVTGCEDTVSIDRAFELGATDFISKPVNWGLIAHRLRYILRGAHTRQALDASESRNRALIEALPDQIFILEPDGRILQEISNQCVLAFGNLPNLVGENLCSLLPEDVADRFRTMLHQTLTSGETPALEFAVNPGAADESHYECRLIGHDAESAVAIVRDVTERKRTEERIHDLAFYDTLTGLANRHMFLQQAGGAISACGANGRKLALIYLNLDQFKRINDSLGHQIGDRLLVAVSNRLRDQLPAIVGKPRPSCELARVGGDEFVIVLDDVESDQSALDVATRLSNALTKPIFEGRHNFVVTPSIGISMYPRDGYDLETLLKNADTAMHQAKAGGRNTCRMYTQAMNARATERLALEGDLRKALGTEQLRLQVQPRFTTRNLEVCGAEALIRWQHPTMGNVPPGEFIPLAESTGIISEIDGWVMRAACEQQRAWLEAGVEMHPLAINLSAGEFCRPQTAERLANLARANGMSPDLMEVEITEGVLMLEPDTARVTLAKLKDAGFRIAIDDFGTGYSSLAYLKSFAVDILKIDQSFVCDMESDTGNQTICRAIIAMAHSLRLEVVAEGVETRGQFEILRSEGCDQIQGFWSGRPMEVADYEKFLADHEGSMFGLMQH